VMVAQRTETAPNMAARLHPREISKGDGAGDCMGGLGGSSRSGRPHFPDSPPKL
jgi:hypothetical protein